MGELAGSPAISVILPILNEESHLSESIAAILNQDCLGRFEVILALGPSSDNTKEIAENIAAQDERIKLIENPSGKTAAGGPFVSAPAAIQR